MIVCFGCRKGLLASKGHFDPIPDPKHHGSKTDIVTLAHFGLMPGKGNYFIRQTSKAYEYLGALIYFSYFTNMNLPNEAYDLFIAVILISIAMTMVGFLTNRSRNFRSRRNKRARIQFPSKLQ